MSFPDTSAPIGLCPGMRNGERNPLKNIRKTLGMMAVTGAIVAAPVAFGTGAHPTTRLCLRWLEH